MARFVWITPEGKAEAKAEGLKGTATKQRNRDRRKAQAIALDGKGLDPNAIATKLGCSRRSVMRYLKK